LLHWWTCSEPVDDTELNNTDDNNNDNNNTDDDNNNNTPQRPLILIGQIVARDTALTLCSPNAAIRCSFVAPSSAVVGAIVLLTEWRVVRWHSSVDATPFVYVEVAQRGFVVLHPSTALHRDDSLRLMADRCRSSHDLASSMTAAVDLSTVAARALSQQVDRWLVYLNVYINNNNTSNSFTKQ
jgi:hypothetical protein